MSNPDALVNKESFSVKERGICEFKIKYAFVLMYMLCLINSYLHLQTTTQMTFWLSDAALWQEIASSPPNVLLCGAERLKELRLNRNNSTTLNIAVQHWSDHDEGIYWKFLWENGFRKGCCFITYSISHLSSIPSTQGMFSPLLPGYKEQGWFFSL